MKFLHQTWLYISVSFGFSFRQLINEDGQYFSQCIVRAFDVRKTAKPLNNYTGKSFERIRCPLFIVPNIKLGTAQKDRYHYYYYVMTCLTREFTKSPSAYVMQTRRCGIGPTRCFGWKIFLYKNNITRSTIRYSYYVIRCIVQYLRCNNNIMTTDDSYQ